MSKARRTLQSVAVVTFTAAAMACRNGDEAGGARSGAGAAAAAEDGGVAGGDGGGGVEQSAGGSVAGVESQAGSAGEAGGDPGATGGAGPGGVATAGAAGESGGGVGAAATGGAGGAGETPVAITPAVEPSGAELRLDRLFYADGDAASATLLLGGIVPEASPQWVAFAVPDSGDVEARELTPTGAGVHRTLTPIPIAAGATGVPHDGTLTVPPGSQLVALYLVDRSDAGLAGLAEDLLTDTALLEAAPDESVLDLVEPALALTPDEAAPPPGGKRVGTLLARGGLPVQIATEELVLHARSGADLDRFLELTGGTPLAAQTDLDADGAPTGYVAHLIAVDPGQADLDHLPLLRALYQEADDLLVSRVEVLGVLTLALEAQAEGLLVSVNPRLLAAGAPAISADEAERLTYTMELGPHGCAVGDPERPCVFNVPALWAYLALVDRDGARVNAGVLDMGFAPNDDFRPPAAGARVECDFTGLTATCGPGAATGKPTVGASFFGGRVYHGTGVVTTLGGVVNDGFGAAGVAGQVAVPMLYEYDTASYAFEMGAGLRRATDDGASVINVSAGYPCRVLTNGGPDFDLCSPAGRTGSCLGGTAAGPAAAGLVCAVSGPIPIAGAIACGAAMTGAAAAVTACTAQLALGDVRGPLASGVGYARRAGVPVVTVAGNPIPAEVLPEVLRDYVNVDVHRTETWGMVPAMIPGAIVVGAVWEDGTNAMFFGDRVDVWAPIESGYVAPEDPDRLTSPLVPQTLGGTSAAAPYVAGVVAAMQAVNPELDPRAPGTTDDQRAGMVDRIRSLLLDDASTFDDAELVALGFTSDAVERRRLIDPLGAVLAAARGRYPDLAALGYDTSLGFSELTGADDHPEDARELPAGVTVTGTILTLPATGSATAAEDEDHYRFAVPASPAVPHETVVTLTYPSSIGSLLLEGENLALVSRGGAPDTTAATYRTLADAGATVRFAVAGGSGQDGVYRLSRAGSAPAAPTVAIDSPADGASVCAGEAFTARATASYGAFPAFTVPSSAIAWTEGTTALGVGAARSVTLAAGAHTLTASAYGGSDTVTVSAIACASTAPIPFITQPAGDLLGGAAVHLDFFDEEAGSYYAELTLEGYATDAEDGAVAESGLAWYTDRDDLQPVLLGTGSSVTVRLYAAPAGCPAERHEIRLVARDSSGTVSATAATVRVDVFLLC